VALLAAWPATTAVAQTPVERGSYLVNIVMTCHNCHTPMGPNGPQFDKALSGGLRFNEPPFDVTGSNLTPDPETGLGKWSDADFKTALLEGIRPSGHHLAEVMPTGFYKILTPGDLDGIIAYLRSLKPVSNKVRDPVYKMEIPHKVFPGAEKPMSEADLGDKVKRGFYLSPLPIAWSAIRHSVHLERERIFRIRSARGAVIFPGRGARRPRATSRRARSRA
jgi:mono/diheme cytochrome c family protein